MFELITYTLFALAAVMLIVSPLAVLGMKRGYKYFGILIFFLYVAQLFMYAPGSDVSPWAFSVGRISAFRVAGLTLSAFVSIVLLAFIFFNVLLRQKVYSQTSIVMLLLALLPNLIGLVGSDSIMSSLDYFIKIISPFIIYFYMSRNMDRDNVDWFKRLITTIQLLLVLQVLACKVIYGHFAAHNYYYEMSEEYFGYYNHPHSFTGLLAFLCLWNVYEINRKERVALNIVLALISLLLMYISGVRTYVVALAAGLLCVGIYSLQSSSMKRLRNYVYLAIVAMILVGPKLLSSFGVSRVTGDVSSGRFERWFADVSYVLNHYSVFELLFGRGLEASVSVNQEIFGVSINSLNLFVDMFMDYGGVGMLLMTVAYISLFKLTWTKQNRGFQMGMLVTFFVTCFINSVVSYITIMTMMVLILHVMKVEGESLHESSCVESSSVS